MGVNFSSKIYAALTEVYNRHSKRKSASRPGCQPTFDREIYRRRNVVERCINRLKQWRGLATRYDKRATSYRTVVVIAALMIWLDQ